MAEAIALEILKEEHPKKTFEQTVGKNSDYDIIQSGRSKNKMTIEVKFDMKAKQTGNLCFEITNGVKPTGVCISKAQEIWYVLETKKKSEFTIIKFKRAELLQYLLFNTILNPSKQRVLFGGDRRSFGLIIVPLETILKEIETIGEVRTWQVAKS